MSSLEIGEEADALICVTNNVGCCFGSVGNWYLPNLSKLWSESSHSDIFIDRGTNVVRLNHRKKATFPSGVFRCEIPDANGNIQNIYIGVYSERSGHGVVIASELTFDKRKQALSCTSTGGAPTTVSWSKNGEPLNIDGSTYQQSQIIINASRSTYVTTVFIHPLDHHKVVGNYSCSVSNSRVIFNGSSQHTMYFKIQGKLTHNT